jgi:phosphoenolpyruvate carboxylase
VFTRLPVTRKLSVCACFRLNDWDSPIVDVVPLFESIDDLSNAYYHGTTLLESSLQPAFG